VNRTIRTCAVPVEYRGMRRLLGAVGLAAIAAGLVAPPAEAVSTRAVPGMRRMAAMAPSPPDPRGCRARPGGPVSAVPIVAHRANPTTKGAHPRGRDSLPHDWPCGARARGCPGAARLADRHRDAPDREMGPAPAGRDSGTIDGPRARSPIGSPSVSMKRGPAVNGQGSLDDRTQAPCQGPSGC
jgi:hypothetical protein